MNFYETAAHAVYMMRIGDTQYYDYKELIEEIHNGAKHKGPVFYQNLILPLLQHFHSKIGKIKDGDRYSEKCLKYIEYCNDKISELTGPSAKKTEDEGFKEANYCLTPKQISDLYELFIAQQVINKISLADFLSCFDLSNVPKIKPTFPHTKQCVFVYALSKINSINPKLALSHFGIKNYKSLKVRPLVAGKTIIEGNINDIFFNNALKVTNK